jgi:hypothetical protein
MIIDGDEHGRYLMHFSVENHDFSLSLAIDLLCLNVFFHHVKKKLRGRQAQRDLICFNSPMAITHCDQEYDD